MVDKLINKDNLDTTSLLLLHAKADKKTLKFPWGNSKNLGRSTTLLWVSSDNEKSYNKNLKEQFYLLEANNWIDRTIEYKFNEHGFRSDSFKTKCKILFNGCSHTFGVGLPVEHTFSYRVSQHYDCAYHNIAVPGSAWQDCAQRIYFWLPVLKPEILVIKEPPMARFSWYTDTNNLVATTYFAETEIIDCIIHNDQDDIYYPVSDLMSVSANTMWHRTIHKAFIEQVCNKHDCKVLWIPHQDFTSNNPELDYARDLGHRGSKENKVASEYIISELDFV